MFRELRKRVEERVALDGYIKDFFTSESKPAAPPVRMVSGR